MIDKVAVVHTRPVGGGFRFDRTLEEERGMLANYRLSRRSFKHVMVEDETAPKRSPRRVPLKEGRGSAPGPR